jgi:hypothetical protein
VGAPDWRTAFVGQLAGIGATALIVAIVALVVLSRPPAGPGPARPPEITLPTHRELSGYPAALLFAQLVQDGDCFYAADYRSDERHLVVWPSGSAVDVGRVPPVVMVPGGEEIAVGEPVELGGGEFQMDQLAFLRTLLENDIAAECHGGPYWLASTARSPLAGAGPATWRIDPAGDLGPAAQSVRILLTEIGCANGLTPEGRLLEPVVEYRADAITISLRVRQFKGADCPSNPEYPLTIKLSEPIGRRALVDGEDGAVRWKPAEQIMPVPTIGPPLSNGDCYPTYLEGAFLAGAPDDPAVAWVVSVAGERVDVQWPVGFAARFSPDVELLGRGGVVVARRGDVLTLAGGFTPAGLFAACEVHLGSIDIRGDPLPWPGEPTPGSLPSAEADQADWETWELWIGDQPEMPALRALATYFPAPDTRRPPAAITLTSPLDDDLEEAALRRLDDEVETGGLNTWSSSEPSIWLGEMNAAARALNAVELVADGDATWVVLDGVSGADWHARRLKRFATPAGHEVWALDERLVAYADCADLVAPPIRADGVDVMDTNFSLEEGMVDVHIFGDGDSYETVTLRHSDRACRAHPVMGPIIDHLLSDD